MLHKAQGYPQYIRYKEYESEESEFKKRVKCVPITEVLFDAKIISSRTIYTIDVEGKNFLV